MRLPLMLLAGGLICASASADAAECKAMIFFDQNGAIVQTAKPIAGLMLGGVPILGPVDVPGAVKREVGTDVPCPQELVAMIQELFDNSCLSEANRQGTVRTTKSDMDTVNRRCAEMAQALLPSRAK